MLRVGVVFAPSPVREPEAPTARNASPHSARADAPNSRIGCSTRSCLAAPDSPPKRYLVVALRGQGQARLEFACPPLRSAMLTSGFRQIDCTASEAGPRPKTAAGEISPAHASSASTPRASPLPMGNAQASSTSEAAPGHGRSLRSARTTTAHPERPSGADQKAPTASLPVGQPNGLSCNSARRTRRGNAQKMKKAETPPHTPSDSESPSSTTSSVIEGSSSRPKRANSGVKRKRLIEDDNFDEPCVKRDLMSKLKAHTLDKLKTAANAMAQAMPSQLFLDWSGSRNSFEVGDHVMARYSDGQWFAAIVEEQLQQHGEVKFYIKWDDGDHRSRVKKAKEMMLLDEFARKAGRAIKRQKSAGAEEKERGGKGKAEPTMQEQEQEKSASNAKYNWEVAGEGAYQRRDWGLKMVDAVGRNKPPFSRTMLYYGTPPFPLPADVQLHATCRGSAGSSGAGAMWVVKRWPDKVSSGRKKIDKQVHERIQQNPHPHVVRILDVSPSEGLLMEYFDEGDLLKHMTTARRKFLPVFCIVRYLVQIIQALHHLHELDIVHCDVSPANVFLRRDRDKEESLQREAAGKRHRVKDDVKDAPPDVVFSCALGDFGHSYIDGQHEESRSSVAGQGLGALFVAPEVKEGGHSTKESDIWSAGKILEELLKLSESNANKDGLQPKSVLRKLRGISLEMCSDEASRRPTARTMQKRIILVAQDLKCL